MVLLIRNTVVIFTLSIGAYAWGSSSPAHNSRCYDETVSTRALSVDNLTNFLDCIATDTHLSLVAAQWIIVNKAHWQFENISRLGRDEYDFAIKGIDNSSNPMNPLEKHKIEVNLNHVSTSRENFESFIQWLEQDVFPAILNGAGSAHPNQNRTSWSIDASFHHYLAYHDTPLPKSARYKGEGSRSGYYKGTLLESERWKGNWYQKYFNGLKDRSGRHQQRVAFTVLETSFLGTDFWPQLRQQYRRLQEDESTRCLFRQERKVVQALFTLLDHPDLVEAMHFQSLPGFGPSQSDYDWYVERKPHQEPHIQTQIDAFLTADIWGRGEALPRVVGSLGFPINSTATGDLDIDYSLTGCSGYSTEECDSQDYATHINYAAFGAHGLIGRPLYIEAFNKSIRNNNGSASFYQGQNAITRNITEDGARALAEMRGLGNKNSERISTYDGYMVRPENRPTLKGHATTATLVTDAVGVRQVIARADQLVDELFPYGTASYWLADYSRKANQGQSVSGHVVKTNPYFKETLVSFGMTITQWADFLKRKQPGLRYYISVYDYGLRQREQKRPNFKSYYDRMLEILDPAKGRRAFREFEL